jgi:hypothetical protein
MEVPEHDQLELGALGAVDVILSGEWGRELRHGLAGGDRMLAR